MMHVDLSFYRLILEKSFPQIHIHSLSTIQTGWDTLALVVNDGYIFRFPRRPENEAQLEKEMELLALLVDFLPLPVPQVEFASHKTTGDAHTLMGYPKIPGTGLETISGISDRVVRQLGEFLTVLHALPIEQAQPIVGGSSNPQDWRKQYQEMFLWVRDQAFPHLDKPDKLAASLLWEAYLSNDDHFNFQPMLIHGDLAPEHILCAPDGSAVCGVIDWGDARLGDAAQDFAGLFSLGGEPLVDRILSSYLGQVDETFRRRVRFFNTIAPFYGIRYALTMEDETLLKREIACLSQNLRV